MKKLLSLILSVVLAATTLSVLAYGSGTGIALSEGDIYTSTKDLGGVPYTVEIDLEVSSSYPDSRNSVILSNRGNGGGSYFELQIRGGYPALVWKTEGGSEQLVNFTQSNVNLRDWGRGHLTVTVDGNKVTVYNKGDEARSRADKTLGALSNTGRFALGNSLDLDKTLLDVTLYSVAIFSSPRSSSQIKSDMNGIDTSDSTLLAYYDFTGSSSEALKDRSSRKNDLTFTEGEGGSGNGGGDEGEDLFYKGMTFTSTAPYVTDSPVSTVINTVEAAICFPTAPTGRGGVILGSYNGNGGSCINLEIYTDGHPRIYWESPNGNGNIVFDGVNVYTGKWVHLCLVRDNAKKEARCYVNGVLAQTKTYTDATETSYSDNLAVGGDRRSGNSMYFKGQIALIRAYSDVRTDAEIASDFTSETVDPASLVLAYDLSTLKESGTYRIIEDKSGNGNHAKYNTGVESPLIYDKAPVTGYDYSFAVLGDTQIVSIYDIRNGTKYFDGIYGYILDNLTSKKIKSVIGVGDIMDNKDANNEWPNAKKVIGGLFGKVPHVLARGNHDPRGWYKQLTYEPYGTQFKEKYGDSVSNAYLTFTAGGNKYLVMALDYGVTDEALEWANGIIAANPDHNVIITTHGYMEADGSLTDKNGAHPATNDHSDGNNGVDIWNKLLKKHKNIVLLLCGHISTDTIVMRQDKGDHGNVVTQIMVNSQNYEANNGPMGFVTMFYFSNGGSKVTVEYYSTVKEAYFLEDNQFTFELAVVNAGGEVTTPEDTTTKKDETTTPDETTAKNDETTPDGSSSDNGTTPSDETSSDGTSVTDGQQTSRDETDSPDTTEVGSPDTTDDGGKGGSGKTIAAASAVAVIVIGIAAVVTVLVTRKKKS